MGAIFVSADSKEVAGEEAEGRDGVSGRGGTPPAFSERAWNSLIAKKLSEHILLKSAQEFEKKGLNLALFLQKSAKSGGRAVGGAVWVRGRILFNTEVTESTEEETGTKRRQADPSLRSG